jgi:AraC-like DNA-binding protein
MSSNRGDIRVDRYDLAGARAWMAGICGPHLLKTSSPERLHFHHSGNILKSMATTLGTLEYGTDVTISVEDVEHLNCYSLSLPVVGEQELLLGGNRLLSDADHGLILSPDDSQELTIAGNCRKVQVAITQTAMHQTLEQMLQRPIQAPLRFASVMDAVNGSSASWWRLARYHLAELENSHELYDQVVFSRDIESALIKGLILAQPNNYSAELRQLLDVKLPFYLLRAKDFMHANAREAVHLEDIERASGVSRFKLFEEFKKHFAMSPMAYLKKYRLSAVRQEMLEDRSARNISVIALGWGFTHLGRFSTEYRKLFGESPSVTLQRNDARRNA